MNIHMISDYDIQAYIDNELNHEKAKTVRAYIEENRHARERYKKLVAQKDLLKSWWKNLQN